MAKLTLTDIAAGYLSIATYNANNVLLEAALENTLSRDGTAPNTMSADLDLNSNKITNLTDGTNAQDAVSLAQVQAMSSLVNELSDMDDITSAAVTSGYVLVADGSAYVGRALVEADISDLGTYLSAVQAGDIDAEASTDGYVLTSDGGGNAAWEAAPGVGGVTELVDLSDVTTAAITARFALMADGAAYVGRAIVEADISDLGSYLTSETFTSVVQDTTPQLGGDLDTNGNDITGAGLVNQSNLSASELGYKGAPQRIQNGNYTLILTDAGKQIYKASGGAGETYTIPANASVAFPIGTIVIVINDGGGDLSIAITTDTLEKYGASTGTQTLGDNNKAVLEKVTATLWKYSSTD